MAPAKKSKSVNKGFADFSPSKGDKYKQKKRKVTDMLGPQWSKLEIEHFYEAYRKYGRDWKKVSSVLRSRSMEMVEALYNMNRAYLSLPEGTASVVGLIAMMTDHYNVMDGNSSERDNDEPMVMGRKLQKYPKAKGRLDSSREDSLQHQSIGSSDRCLSLLKMRYDALGIQPYFPVRKRTPRVPVSCMDTRPNKKSRGSVMKSNNDEVSHGALLSSQAQQTPSSPHVSPVAYRKADHMKTSKASVREKVPKHNGSAVDEEAGEGSLGSNEANNGDLVMDYMNSGKSSLPEYKKGKKGKKLEVEHTEAKVLYGIREGYSLPHTAEGGKVDFGGAGAKIHRSPSEGQKKRNKKLTFEDERAACDALQTLAEMSLMMPYLAGEPVEDAGESVTGLDTIVDTNAHSDVILKDVIANGNYKKKHKAQTSKVMKAETQSDCPRKRVDNESLADEEVKSADSSGQISTVSKRCKSSVRSPDMSSSNDRHTGEAEITVSSTQVHSASQVVLSTRSKSSRKRDRTLPQKNINYAQTGCSSECSSFLHDEVQSVKDKISHCLSWRGVRRWCKYEWFYSAIDYPWFAKREFVEYLNHVGLGHIPRLTRVEWGVIRSSLGKPRRFSEHFLREERDKLKQYRESVRAHYANLRAGLGEGLPTDLARPLSVGQQVVAIHPKTTEFHNGSILTVDRDNCLVQFDRPDLGVELVMDIDCMPLNPVENMPEALMRQNMSYDFQYSQVPQATEAYMSASVEHMQNADYRLLIPSFNPLMENETKVKPACLSSHAKVSGSVCLRRPSAAQRQSGNNMAQMQLSKGDVGPIPGLTQSLDRKFLDQHTTCPGNPTFWPQPAANSVGPTGNMHSSNNAMCSSQETASNVANIVDGSRDKAQRMVYTAIKAMSLMKEGEDAFGRIQEALDTTNKAECSTRASLMTASNSVQGSLHHGNLVSLCKSEPEVAGGVKSVGSAASDPQVPSELITSCVATLLMIQTCTERQYPPAEVAQILDNAVTSLHPSCSQNLSIYREIQMCMGRIKTQILALVPT